MKLATSAQMRALEQKAVAAGTSLDALMDAAGLAVAQEAWLSLGVVAGRRVAVLVGPGNNGGDGLVAALHLAGWEADVAVYLLVPRDDARVAAVRDAGIPVHVAAEDGAFRNLDDVLAGADLVVDALLGTGRSRAVEGELAEVLRRLDAARERPNPPTVVAVDVPTGVDADSGHADPLAVRASMTVTLGMAKPGLFTLPGSEHAGTVQVVDIGIPRDAEAELPLELLDAAWVRARLPERPKQANKGTFGRVMVVAGSLLYPGAARLTAEACYRAGAGLTTVACPSAVEAMVVPALAEATYLPYETDTGALTPLAGRDILAAFGGYDVLLIGPGISQAAGTADAVSSVLAGVPDGVRGCVVDADALNALAKRPDWHRQLARPCILTPHPGEMARLLDSTVEQVQGDRLNVAMRAASMWGQAVVLKGAHTVVAAPDGRAAVSPHANPLLATAGTGDVLAGVAAGLLAQGMEAFEAAACAVYVHGRAAEDFGETFGDRGMLAGDLLPAIPRAIRAVREGRPLRRASTDLPDLAGGRGADFLSQLLGQPQ